MFKGSDAMTDRNSLPRTTMLAFMLGSALLAGCGGEAPDKLLASARDYMAKGDAKAAVIQAKNALAKQPESAEARFVLGRALLETGDLRGAEQELAKARDLRYSVDAVVPLLLQIWLETAKFDKVIAEGRQAGLLTADAKVKAGALVARAQIATGKPAEAQETIAGVLRAAPDNAGALLVQARLRMADKDVKEALALAERAIEKAPAAPDGLIFKGEVLVASGRAVEGLAALRRAVEVAPKLMPARAALVIALLQGGAVAEAKDQLASMKQLEPSSARVIYTSALVASAAGDFNGAREACLALLKAVDENAGLLQLAGTVEFSLGSMVQAEEYLARSVKLAPESVGARRYLALTYMGMGQPKKAVDALEPILNRIEGDAITMAILGKAHFQAGAFESAERLLGKAAKLDPKNAEARTNAALARAARGEVESALSDLTQISREDSGTVADFSLLATLMRRGDHDRALAAVEALDKKKPGDPQTQFIKGQVLLAKKDLAGARKSFEAALSAGPGLLAAAERLAEFDIADNRPAEAQRRIEGVIAATPKSAAALLALAAVKVQVRAPAKEVEDLVRRALTAQPADPRARVALVIHFINTIEPKKALEAAQEASAALPADPSVLEALGQAQEAAGDLSQAIVTYGRLAVTLPDSPQPYLRMAEAQVSAKSPDAAAQSLRKALERRPDLLEAQRRLFRLSVSAGKPAEALAIARQVQKQRPQQSAGYMLEGDLAALRKDWLAAAAIYQAGWNKVKAPELGIRQHGALWAGGKRDEAEQLAASWLKDFPNDTVFPLYLAESALQRGDFPAAMRNYSIILKRQPQNPAILNNLAMAAASAGQPAEALQHAEKANALVSNEPAFMDTLAVLLFDKGDTARALDLQAKAVQAAPLEGTIRFNYARMLVKMGRKAEARKELEEIASWGERYPAQAEVASLLRQL
jgi:cellulose synthase operon protein C